MKFGVGANNGPKTTWYKFQIATAIFWGINRYPLYSIADHYSFKTFHYFVILIKGFPKLIHPRVPLRLVEIAGNRETHIGPWDEFSKSPWFTCDKSSTNECVWIYMCVYACMSACVCVRVCLYIRMQVLEFVITAEPAYSRLQGNKE